MKKVTCISLIFLHYGCMDGVKGYSETKYRYKVEVTYCDSRSPKIIITEPLHFMPTNVDISTYKQAVPVYEGEVNVCEIKVLKRVR